MKNKRMLSSDNLLALLKAKHSKDVFVDECKNGESYSSHLLKLDAWVLRRSWSPLTTIGYEIKASRSDFERDQKWMGYTDYCHEFFFVCPAGLIKAVDLPKGIGLIWTTMSGTGLQTKIKAERRKPDPEKLNQLMTYVIMARSVIVQDMYQANNPPVQQDRIQFLADSVREAEARKALSFLVRGNIRNRHEEMHKRCEEADRKEKRVDNFVRQLALLGITWDPKMEYWNHDRDVRNEIELLGSRVDDNTLYSMKDLATRIQNVVGEIEGQRQRAKSKVESIVTTNSSQGGKG